MKTIYLDACILVAYYSKNKEKDKNELIKNCITILSTLDDIELCSSSWAVAEMMNVLISRMQLDRQYVYECEQELINTKRLGDIKIKFVDVSIKKGYDFTEFFYDIRKGILQFHSGVGDIIHSVIMNNNNIHTILTFDEKNDFKQIPNLEVIHPKNVKF